MKINIEDINSAGIRAQGKIDGITEVELIAQAGDGDHKVTVYRFGGVLVADTNADPVWQESDPNGFDALLEASGITLEH